jgi:two-component system sensor kinase FixL
VFWGVVQWPLMSGLLFLGIVAAMGYELASEELRLTRDLRARDQQITLAAQAAKLGFWSRDIARNEIWASDQWRDLFGFSKSEPLYLDTFLQRLHPDDREKTHRALEKANEGDGLYHAEYRVVLPNNTLGRIARSPRIEQ